MPSIGDIKTSIKTVDHGGWFLLDGRDISTLSADAAANAAGLGFSVLPNTQGSVLSHTDHLYNLGNVSGSNNVLIERNQLPSIVLGGTTNVTGSHIHTGDTSLTGAHVHPIDCVHFGPAGSGTYNSVSHLTDEGHTTTMSAGDHTHGLNISSGGDHSHSFILEDLNGGVVQSGLNIQPRVFKVNFFIWLLSS